MNAIGKPQIEQGRLIARAKYRHAKTLARRVKGRAMGAGGGGKGGAGGIEAPNSLQSKAIVTIIDLLSEGPIGGLQNGAESIYFNNIPLMNSAGQYNFLGVTYQVFTGTEDQGAAQGFPAIQSTFPLDEQITHTAPIEYVTSTSTCTRLTVTIEIPALFITDTHNGNINGTQVEIQINLTDVAGTVSTPIQDTISGKCTSPYERSYTFPLTGSGPWTVTMIRVTPDSTTANTNDETYVSNIDEITDYQMLYPDSAYIALTFDAQYFGSSIPSRTYDIVGRLIQVPLNYNPTTGVYATSGAGTSGGTWDGVSYQTAACNNPAFIALDLISNNRYGLGLPDSVLQFTKWDLYTIAQYCDGTVPDGFGGMERRYTCDLWMSSQDDAYRVMQTVASIWRGMTYWGAGSLRFTADMPQGISAIINQADVIDGNFTYEGTSLKTRHTTAIVNYLDPGNYWQPQPAVYQDPELLVTSLLGPNLITVNAIGAKTYGQAYRQGHWLLDCEQHRTDTVTFKSGWNHIGLRPGQIIAVADPAYAGLRYGGRLLAVSEITYGDGSALQLNLDGPVVPESGQTYALSYTLIDGTLAQAQSVLEFTQNANGTTTVVVAVPEVLPDVGATWIMISSNLAPRQFTVVGITVPQRGQVEVTALYFDPTSFDRVELGIDLSDDNFSVLPSPTTAPLTPPTNVSVNDYFVGEGSTTVLRTTVGWTPTSDYRVQSYTITASSDEGYLNTWTDLTGPSYDIDNLPIANYVFGVQSVGSNGETSAWAYSSEVDIDGSPIPPPQVTGLTVIGGTRMMSLNWNDVGIQNLLYYQVWRAPVTGSTDGVGGTVGTYAMIATVSATNFTDSNSEDLQPLTTWSYYVVAESTLLVTGEASTAAQAETTALLVNDLPLAIQATAAFAESLLGATPTVVSSLPGAPTAGYGYVVLSTSTPPGQLYQWNATEGEWTPTPVLIDATSGQLIAGVVAAGVITADQIAANSINAGCLASTTLLTEQAQIGYAVVGTLQLINDSVTSLTTATTTPDLTGAGITAGLTNVLTMSVSVPSDRTGFLLLDAQQGQGPPYTSGAYHFEISQDGTVLFDRSTGGYQDYPTFSFPITLLASAANEFTVSWEADTNVGLAAVTLTAFGRIK